MENICFSEGDEVINGTHTVYGTTFTMGALVAQTVGISINESLVGNDTLNWRMEGRKQLPARSMDKRRCIEGAGI